MPVETKTPSADRRVRRYRRVAVAAGLLLVGCFIGMVIDPANAGNFGPLGVLVGTLTAGALLVRGAQALPDEERRAWMLIGSGIFMAGIGVLSVGVSEVLGYATPAFGPFDTFFIGGYLLFILGALLLPHVIGTWRHRVRVSLDGLVGAVSVATLSWVVFLSDVWSMSGNAPTLDRALGMLYPALDTAILVVLMLVTVRRGTYRFDLRLVWVVIGYVALTVGDLSYFAAGAGQAFSDVQPNFFLYLIAIGCFLVTASRVGELPAARDHDIGKTPWWAMALPYGLAAAMGAFLVVHLTLFAESTDVLHTDVLLLLATLLVGILVVVRQAVAIQENRALVETERSALVSSISHELRTPLTSMIGFLELLESDEAGLDPAERTEFTEIVRDQAHYMGRIVMDLVLLSRDDHKKVALREEDIDAASIVRAAIGTMGGSADRISVDVENGIELRVDGDRVVQMVTNLLTNAIRYGSGNVLLQVSSKGPDFVIEVHDNGPGVPKKYQQVIWDRFERGAHRYSSTVRGSGIGLAIVAAIVSAHDGTYGYRTSQALGGGCFWFVLPGCVVNSAARQVPASRRSGYALPRH